MASNQIELFVETLYGTAFELHVYPSETVVSIKSKISRLEGIPVSQQHLIWQSKELEDDSCLKDHNITSGSTLKLVLGMRGGPINTRKVSLEERPSLLDVARYLEAKGEELAQSITNLNPLTVVVVHNGDQVHLYTLVNSTGRSSISPLSDSFSDVSVKEQSDDYGFENPRQKENQITRQKINFLQKRLKSAKRRKSKKSSSNTSATSKRNNNPLDEPVDSNYSSDSLYLPPLQPSTSLLSNGSLSSNKKSQPLNFFQGNEQQNRGVTTPPVLVQLAQRGTLSIGANLDYHTKAHLPRKVANGQQNIPDNNQNLHVLLKVSKDGSRLPSRGKVNKIVTLQSPPTVTPPWWQNIVERQPPDSKRFYKVLPPLSKQAPFAVPQDPVRHRMADSKNVPSLQCLVELDPWDYKRPKTTPARYVHLSVRTPGDNTSSWPSTHSFSEERISGSSNNVSLSVLQQGLLHSKYCDTRWRGFVPSMSLERIASFQHSSRGKISLVAADVQVPGNQEGISLNTNRQHREWFPKVPGTIDEVQARPKTKEASESKLPPIKTKKKLNKRCSWCSRKTGLASTYICRCGKSFCASHRYAEMHECSHDYKTEGRRLLQKSNPVVKASKLPEI